MRLRNFSKPAPINPRSSIRVNDVARHVIHTFTLFRNSRPRLDSSDREKCEIELIILSLLESKS